MRTLLLLTLLAATPGEVLLAADTAPDGHVTIKNFTFSPATVTIKAGSSVTWTNRDNEPHTIVGDIARFRSGAVDTDESYSFKFDQPGTYHFACSLHPMMTGVVVVE